MQMTPETIPLHEICKNGGITEIKKLLSAEYVNDLPSEDIVGSIEELNKRHNCIHYKCTNFYEIVINLLYHYSRCYIIYSLLDIFKSKINTEIYGQLLFEMACSYGHLELVKKLLNEDYNVYINDKTTFREACSEGHLNVAKYLLSYTNNNNININLNYTYAFHYACSAGHLDVAKWLYSIEGSNINLNIDNNNIFRTACKHGKLNVVKFLLDLPENNININAGDNTEYVTDKYRDWTAFNYACEYGHLDIIKYLLSLPDNNIKVSPNDFQNFYNYVTKNIN